MNENTCPIHHGVTIEDGVCPICARIVRGVQVLIKEEEIEVCPFCHDSDSLSRLIYSHYKQIHCKNCGATGPVSLISDNDSAWNKWAVSNDPKNCGCCHGSVSVTWIADDWYVGCDSCNSYVNSHFRGRAIALWNRIQNQS